MEQITNGMLEVVRHVGIPRMTPGKTDIVSNGDNDFGRLLDRRQIECKRDKFSEKKEPADSTAPPRKPEAEKKSEPGSEEETCDAAREAACAQIVWLMPEVTTEEQVVMQEVNVELVVGEAVEVIHTDGEAVQMQEILQPQETAAVTEEMAETGLDIQQTVVATDETPEPEITEQETKPFVEKVETKVETEVETDETGVESVAVEAPLFKDVEAAPIKVAEAPVKAEASDATKQVSQKLTGALEAGESRVEIQLTPESLGKVTIELTRSADGALSIVLNAENEQTRELLSKHVSTLQESIVDRGQQNVQIEINRGEESQNQQNTQQDLQDGKNGNHPEQQRRQQENDNDDFLQQLRLGLIDIQEES